MMTRRTFGCIAGAGLAGLLNAAGKKIPIGVQLYSVRKLCANDLAGTLAGVAKLGYQGVEFAGYYNNSAKDLKKLLDANGLKCCGTHTAVDTILGDKIKETIEFNKTIGNKFLIVPGLPEKYRKTIANWKDTAKLFNEASAKAKEQGMYVGYHNHSIEFTPIDGQIPWDAFFGNTKKEVVMQLDIGHVVHAKNDPVAVLKKYKGRAKTVHVKDWSDTKKDFMLGDGTVDWKKTLPACAKYGGTEWYIIEEETLSKPGLEGIDVCLQRLKKMLA